MKPRNYVAAAKQSGAGRHTDRRYKVTRYYTVWETAIIEAETEDDAWDIAEADDWLHWQSTEGDADVTIQSVQVWDEVQPVEN